MPFIDENDGQVYNTASARRRARMLKAARQVDPETNKERRKCFWYRDSNAETFAQLTLKEKALEDIKKLESGKSVFGDHSLVPGIDAHFRKELSEKYRQIDDQIAKKYRKIVLEKLRDIVKSEEVLEEHPHGLQLKI